MFTVTRIERLFSLWLMFAVPMMATESTAGECSLDVTEIDRGGQSPILLCGAGITADASIEGFEAADIRILYRQKLRHCSPQNRNPGWYLVLRAGDKATDARITVSADRKPLCNSLLAVSGVVHEPPPQPDFLDAMREDEARYVDVNGVRTRYFDKGQGPVLLLVHGGQPSAADFNAWEWQQNFDGLAKDFRVIALDRIGQGYTDNPADLDAYENYYSLVVEHLKGFIHALGLERVHLVGHSQGGWPVTRIALDQPDLVASLVIVDSTMVAPAANATQAVRFYIYHQNDLHPASGETPESIRRGMASFSYTKNNITEQRVQRILTISKTEKYAAASQWFEQHRMSPAHPSFRVLKAGIWEELAAGGLKVPTLIVWGREDPEGSFAAGIAAYEALRQAGAEVSFRAFDESGHVPYMEYPDEFNAVVASFALGHR